MILTLYRRHTGTCVKKHARGRRLYRPSTVRQRNADCTCPISAEGKLKHETIINRSTKKTDWAEAEAVAALWEQWDRTEQPVAATVQYAIESFLASQGPSGRNVEPPSIITCCLRLMTWT